MNKETRNAIERATQRARKLLEEDFAAQLEGDFDVHRSGAVAIKAGRHLSARQAFQRERIVAAIEHKRAGGIGAIDSVADYLRDAAFTTLNRFVALKMLEARELVQECITKGEQSAGYREFCGMAPGVLLLPDSAGYRLYIESLFDELSTEVKVLFDRRDPASVLWPKRATFEQLLDILNATDVAHVWGEDETIGWVYQFFNSKEERAALRDVNQGGSQSPRNSRELAVRNQFFTPRYVVRFLTDNTLGRIWYEMRRTKTVLAENCEYLVCRPHEEFASRAKKDPRDIRVLDPACGSGHFLLYAFDLLLAIYEEAYTDPESPKSEATGKTLAEDYPELDALRKVLPGLIVAHNLHGVDIDARCAQIAQLALWMRAQRAYRDFGIRRVDRSQIYRSNIVVAEPLIADEHTTKDFVVKLGDAELGSVFTALVGALNLAGDLGLLLRVETLVARSPNHGKTGDLFAPPEEQIRAAIARFLTEEDPQASTRRRLFAEDAAHGIGLLSIAETKFDVVLMNPPFGDSTARARDYIEPMYPFSWKDVFRTFVERAAELCPDGLIGALGPRTSMFLPHGEEWRREFLIKRVQLRACADLGIGVLDAAKIEVAAYVIGRSEQPAVFLRVLKTYDKEVALRRVSKCMAEDLKARLLFFVDPHGFESLPGTAFAYWVSEPFRRLFGAFPRTEGTLGEARVGLQTSDDFRFLRLRWEIQTDRSRWALLAKGGEYSPFYSDIHLAVNWRLDGAEVCVFNEERYGSASRNVRSKDRYFEPGITWSPRTTTEFAPRVLPSGCIFGQKGPTLLVKTPSQGAWALAVMNSRVYQYLLTIGAGAADIDPASISKSYGVGLIQSTPVPCEPLLEASRLAVRCWALRRDLAAVVDTTSVYFVGLPSPGPSSATGRVEEWLGSICMRIVETECELLESWEQLSDRVLKAYGLGDLEEVEIVEEVGTLCGPSVFEVMAADASEEDESEDFSGKLAPRGWGFVRRNARQNALAPRQVVSSLSQVVVEDSELLRPFASEAIEFYVGRAFGVWTRAEPPQPATVESLFMPPPTSAPAQVGRVEPVLVDDPGHPGDLGARLLAVVQEEWDVDAHTVVGRMASLAGNEKTISDFLAREFFTQHLKRFSRSRRKAPIYWQLATPSVSYSVWLYVHEFSKDTLFRVQHDYVSPKLAHEERRLESISSELREQATSAQRKKLAAQQVFVEELRAFLEEVKRVAPLWNPNLDDVIIINFAPLWRLVPQNSSWQKELKSTWDALCEGKYDWSHLAMHLWPERVVPKCAKDRSLAIAHGIEDVLWVEGGDGKWIARKAFTRSVEELVRERTSPAAKSALKNLLEAPAMPGNRGRGRAGRRPAVAAARRGDA